MAPTLRANGEPAWDELPSGVAMEFLGVLDNGGRTFDRYHAGFEIIYPGDENTSTWGLDIGPTGNHPQGVCMSTEFFDEMSGEPIDWAELPEPVQRAILGEFTLFESTEGYTKW